jgi:hypothetical protein
MPRAFQSPASDSPLPLVPTSYRKTFLHGQDPKATLEASFMAANWVLEYKSRQDSVSRYLARLTAAGLFRLTYSEAMGRRFHERGSNPHA